jgi:hypothetical protein
MIGDQLDRNIAPAEATGFLAIYFQQLFLPKRTCSDAVKPDYRLRILKTQQRFP